MGSSRARRRTRPPGDHARQTKGVTLGKRSRARRAAVLCTVLAAGAVAASSEAIAQDDAAPTVEGPIPGAPPGDRQSDDIEETYPFFSTPFDLAGAGYVEEEYYLSGEADGWSTTGQQVADDVPYRTRIVVRRPVDAADSTARC